VSYRFVLEERVCQVCLHRPSWPYFHV
jgi:hypothetical protein